MSPRLMLLPAKKAEEMKIVSVPEDYDMRDAHRHATALIATVEEEDADYDWDDIAAVLEEHGFEMQEFILGPDLD